MGWPLSLGDLDHVGLVVAWHSVNLKGQERGSSVLPFGHPKKQDIQFLWFGRKNMGP